MPPMKPPRPRPTQVRIRATPPPAFRVSRSPSPAVHQKPKCKACGSESLEPEEGGLTCTACGAIQAQEINFRAEIEFDETPAGAAQTRGTTIKDGQSHRKNFTSRIPGSASAPGHESVKAEENALRDADYWFQLYATNLQIHQPEVQAARQLFSLAYRSALYRGRTLHSLALVSLYLAIRRQSKTQYPLMLIDFAEINDFNVFDLGQIAQDLQKTLFLNRTLKEWQMWDEEQKKATTPEARQRAEYEKAKLRERDKLNLIGPENLIAKFCAKLDFGDMERKVASDAVRVAKSMNRDWMTDGRRPAGVAGAAIIIASRMNNFRRTLREVVLVAKVTELTVGKRIEEFKETKPSNFSVKEFRDHDISSIRGSDVQDPPAYYQAQPEWLAKKPKRKRGRPRKHPLPERAAEVEGSGHGLDDTEGQPPQKQARIDADGFAVPAIPTRSTDETASQNEPVQSGPRKPGRPPGAKNWQPPPPTTEELEEEAELTLDIQKQLEQNAALNPASVQTEPQINDLYSQTRPPRPGVTDIYPGPSPKDPPGPYVNTTAGNTGYVSLSPTLQADEFEDDEDVAACILTEAERQIKETIWVTENADWLRNEHSKRIKRELKEREMREKGLDPEKEKERAKNKRRKDGMMHSKRVGDVSYLHEERSKNKDRGGAVGRDADGGHVEADQAGEDADQLEDGDTAIDPSSNRSRREPSSDARQAMRKMLQQRGTYSRRVDYESLSNAYKLPGMDDGSDDTSSNNRTPTASPFLKPTTSRGLVSASKRRARDGGKPQREASSVTAASRTRSGSGERASDSPSQTEKDTDDEDSGPTTPVPATTRRRQQQLLTPRATQTRRAAPSRISKPTITDEQDDLDAETLYPATRARTQQDAGSAAGNKRRTLIEQEAEEEENEELGEDDGDQESGEDDGEEEEEYEEDADADAIDPDKFFEGDNAREIGYVGGEEEQVTDDDEEV